MRWLASVAGAGLCGGLGVAAVVWESRALGAACAGSFATAALAAALSSAEDGSNTVAGARPASGAPAPDADPVDTSLVCCLCFELLYEPVALACQHSTCKECLRNLLRAAEDDEDLRWSAARRAGRRSTRPLDGEIWGEIKQRAGVLRYMAALRLLPLARPGIAEMRHAAEVEMPPES